MLKIFKFISGLPGYLASWFVADFLYILIISFFLGNGIDLALSHFLLIHILGIAVGTMVMFTGLGGGILWIPVLTFLNIKPLEAVSISIFTQIAGKGMGSVTYLLKGMVDIKTVLSFIPMVFAGVTLGYLSGFILSKEYERFLLYIFIVVAVYILFKMIQSLYEEDEENNSGDRSVFKSYPVVLISSFFTGLLSIGNTDWLIPHMEQKLKIPTSRAVATGLFIMFITSLFYLILVFAGVFSGFTSWPSGSSVLFATCSGVILGGQVGTRLIRYPWFQKHQKHAFILLLALSVIHLLW